MKKTQINKLIDLTNGHIILDCIESWPDELRLFMDKNADIITNYFDREKERILNNQGKRRKEKKEENKYREEWVIIKNELEDILKTKDYKFIGFHCSRLTDYEIKEVKQNGLIPLSEDLINNKLFNIYRDGKIDYDVYIRLKKNNEVNDESRRGISYFLGYHDLKCEDGYRNFFDLWGGEALFYDNYKKNERIIKTLSNIGKPSIVLCSLHYNEVPICACEFAKMYREYDRNNLAQTKVYGGCINKKLQIVNIIKYEECIFEVLTNYVFCKLET